MKRCLIIFFTLCALSYKGYGQSPAGAVDSLIKFHVITTKERPALERKLKYNRDNGIANYRVAILRGLEGIFLQNTFHVDPRRTGLSYVYNNEHINKKNQDSINMSLRVLLEKIKRAGLLTDRVYSSTLKNINNGRYVVELQVISTLAETSMRLEWLAPDNLLAVADELHKNYILSDSSFLRLKDDINNGRIESAFQLNEYCEHDRIFDLASYPDDPGIWLEQMHRDIASILPGLDFTDFKYTEVPDTSFSAPGIRFKVSLNVNGRTYKHISLPITNYGNPKGKITPKDIFVEDFYRIFNKVLTDQQSPYRLHSMIFSHSPTNEDIGRFALIALKDEQAEVFFKNPLMSYILLSMDGYESMLTSAKIDSTLTGWRAMGLFAHLSKTQLDKAFDDARAADPFTTGSLLSNFPEVVYNLHNGLTGSRRPYGNLLIQLAKITHGAFNPVKIVQIKTGRGLKLQYLSEGKIHSYIFPTVYGWLDSKFPAFMANLSRENNLPGNFYHLKHEDAVIYLNKQQHDYAVSNQLLELETITKEK
ncbi:MAG TPA: hypothetical protein VIM77_03930 [Mucilaginibacter sp.]